MYPFIYYMTNDIFIDCNNGDIRLTGSQWKYEGTVQICLNNIWGLIADSGWHQHDAEVLCLQLGYQAEGMNNHQFKY